jgi:hypothetical protein
VFRKIALGEWPCEGDARICDEGSQLCRVYWRVRNLVSRNFAEIANVFRGFGKFAWRTLMMR